MPTTSQISQVTIKKLMSIFLIRMVSSAAFAVFFSGLSLLLTKRHLFSIEMATTLTGLFLSLNYFLPLIGGVIAKQFNSYKKLYCIASIFSIAGCLILADGMHLYLGLAFILINSLLSNVCIKMFVTNLFSEDQITARKTAFLWNYVGMNAGFLLGFFICGYFFIEHDLQTLFYIMCGLFSTAFILTIYFIKENGNPIFSLRTSITLIATLLLISSIISSLLMHSHATQQLLSILSVLAIFTISLYGYSVISNNDKLKFLTFMGYSLLNIIFWAIYMLTPIAFMQLIENGVNRFVGSIEIAPQWFINIDSMIILCFAPLSAALIKRKNLTTATHYAIGFITSSLALLSLLFGLYAVSHLKIPALPMLGCLVLLAIAELYISPTGDALIGELIPTKLRPIMTGYLSLNMGVGVILSTHIANYLIVPNIHRGFFGQNMINIQQYLSYIAIALLVIGAGLLISEHLVRASRNNKLEKRYLYE